jgi:hypothetical protein
MSARSGENHYIGLQHVGFVEDDVERRDEHDAAVLLDVRPETILKLEHRNLMSGERSRDHHHLAVMQLITAPVIRPALQIPIRHFPRDAQHGSHRSIVGGHVIADSMPCKSRMSAGGFVLADERVSENAIAVVAV